MWWTSGKFLDGEAAGEVFESMDLEEKCGVFCKIDSNDVYVAYYKLV